MSFSKMQISVLLGFVCLHSVFLVGIILYIGLSLEETEQGQSWDMEAFVSSSQLSWMDSSRREVSGAEKLPS